VVKLACINRVSSLKQGPKSEARRSESGRWGCWGGSNKLPSPPARERGEHRKLCQWGSGQSPKEELFQNKNDASSREA